MLEKKLCEAFCSKGLDFLGYFYLSHSKGMQNCVVWQSSSVRIKEYESLRDQSDQKQSSAKG